MYAQIGVGDKTPVTETGVHAVLNRSQWNTVRHHMN